MDSLPGVQKGAAPKTLKFDATTSANLKSVGTVSDGTGRAAIDFPATTGRYIMVKWSPLTQEGASFSVAEIAAFAGSDKSNLVAANNMTVAQEDRIESDGKTMLDGKDLGSGKDAKDMPEEGPEAPAEGPPPALPPPPPFTFIPEILPTSP
jgi:hypothetical protein